MNTRRCLKIAARINRLLKQELGCGIDARRMLADERYANDVLLVCDAMRGHELAMLAERFRRALLADEPPADPPSRRGFSASRFLSSLFGGAPSEPAETKPPAERKQPVKRSWFARTAEHA